MIYIDGNNLTIEDVNAVATGNETVDIAESAYHQIRNSKKSLMKILESGKAVYGVNTGFGSLLNINVDSKNRVQLQINLIRSHSSGIGEPLDIETVKSVMLVRANNPSGNLMDRESIQKVLDSGVTTILDNAYYEFSGEDYTDLQAKYKNLIILRTLSKAFSLAGMRIGYGIADSGFISELKKLQSPFYMNILSARMAEIMIDNYDLIGEKIRYIINESRTFFMLSLSIRFPDGLFGEHITTSFAFSTFPPSARLVFHPSPEYLYIVADILFPTTIALISLGGLFTYL